MLEFNVYHRVPFSYNHHERKRNLNYSTLINRFVHFLFPSSVASSALIYVIVIVFVWNFRVYLTIVYPLPKNLQDEVLFSRFCAQFVY